MKRCGTHYGILLALSICYRHNEEEEEEKDDKNGWNALINLICTDWFCVYLMVGKGNFVQQLITSVWKWYQWAIYLMWTPLLWLLFLQKWLLSWKYLCDKGTIQWKTRSYKIKIIIPSLVRCFFNVTCA